MIKGVPNNEICFLLLPGFNHSNFHIIRIKDKLEKMGYVAFATNFWGTNEKCDFTKLQIADCEKNISSLITELSKKYKVVIGIGISLGGALLLEHAKNHNGLDYLVSIGTPFKLKNKSLISFGFFIYPLAYLFWKVGTIFNLKPFPVPASRMVIDYFEGDFLKGLEKIKTPALFIQSKTDFVTDSTVLPEFSDKISSDIKKIIYLENTDHVLNYNDDLIVKTLIDFMESLQ